MKALTSWFKGIRVKLLISAMVPFLGFIASGTISINGITRLSQLMESMNKEITPHIVVLHDMREKHNIFGFKSSAAILDFKMGRDPSRNIAETQHSITEYKEHLAAYQKITFTPEEEKAYNEVKDSFSQLVATMEKVHSLISAKNDKSMEEADALIQGDLAKIVEITGKFTQDTLSYYSKRANDETVTAENTAASVNLWTILVIAFATVIALILSIWTATSISKVLSRIVDRLGIASASVTTSVEQLSAAGNSLSQSSTEAAASLEETVASLEEMTSMVKLNSDNAKQAAALSASSREAAEKGQIEIESLIKAMSDIAQSSKKIEEIISVIDDIAFQTNLLALNASVEAARAGEQGKGFAVVADAVRALAQRSAEAAKDINHLIKDSVTKVDQGGKIAGQSGTVLNNIVTSVKKVADLNTEIASASTEQTAGIQQISKAMNQMDQAAQSNAASAEEIAATSGEISNLAKTTQSLTEELQIVITGDGEISKSVEASPTVTQAVKPAVTTKVAIEIPQEIPPKVEEKKTPTVPPPKTQLKKIVQKSKAQETIPFDEDDDSGRAKIGTTDGF